MLSAMALGLQKSPEGQICLFGIACRDHANSITFARTARTPRTRSVLKGTSRSDVKGGSLHQGNLEKVTAIPSHPFSTPPSPLTHRGGCYGSTLK
jgi:hypothetical protein